MAPSICIRWGKSALAHTERHSSVNIHRDLSRTHRYTVSQRIALILLVGLNEHDGTRSAAVP